MKKFLVMYHATEEAMKETENTKPEERKKSMDQWMQWAQKCGSNLVDMGSPLQSGHCLSTNGKSSQSKQQVAGYSILQAENIEAAKKMLDGHPHLSWHDGCSIEVHEFLPMPGM